MQDIGLKPEQRGVLLEKWIYYKEVPFLDENGEQVIGADGQPQMKKLMYKKPIVNYFRVFNAEQIIGVPGICEGADYRRSSTLTMQISLKNRVNAPFAMKIRILPIIRL